MLGEHGAGGASLGLGGAVSLGVCLPASSLCSLCPRSDVTAERQASAV